MGDDSIKVTATCVRIPVMGGHSESVNISFNKSITLAEVNKLLASAAGVVVQDNPSEALYPMPLTAQDKDDVFVGRIRMDESFPNTINLWIVSDNLRKGAATNAVQIAEYMFKNGFFA